MMMLTDCSGSQTWEESTGDYHHFIQDHCIMARHSRLEDPGMIRADKKLSHDELVEVLNDVIRLVLDAHNNEIRKDFQKSSRSAQAGYDITMYLLNNGIIKLGRNDPQQRMEV